MDNSIKLEKIKIKSQHLVSLRQLLTQTLAVLIGGLIGIWLTTNGISRIVITVAGSFFVLVLAKSLYMTIYELNKCIYKELEEINNGRDC